MKSEYKKYTESEIENWTPLGNPDPSCDFMVELYLEYVNDYLTVARWSEAHGMDTESGRGFIDLARSIYKEKDKLRQILKNAKNPHL